MTGFWRLIDSTRTSYCRTQIVGCLLLLSVGAAGRAAVLTVTADDTTINVPLPPAALQKGSKLSIELDGYDMTSIAAVQEGQLQFPAQSLGLTPGQHVLRLIRTESNGDLETLMEYTLDVYERPGVRQASQQWTVLLGSSYRLDSRPEVPADGANRWQGNAAIQWSGDIETQHWIGHGSVSSLYNSNKSLSPNNDAWQLPGYEFRAGRSFESGHVALGLGDNTVPLNNLLFSGFSRRGLRLEADALESRVRAQAFTLLTEPTTRVDAAVVPANPDSSVVGGYASVIPFAAYPDVLQVSVGWTDGEGALGGVGINTTGALDNALLRIGGDAWNVALDSFAWRRAFWLHAEHAHSNFDGDGIGIGNPARSDNAHHAIVQLASGGDLTLMALEQWTFGYERQRVGADFYSLGNLMLAGDIDVWHAYTQLGWQGINFDADIARQHTDVADAADRARVHSRRHSLAVSYTPQQLSLERAPWRWLGTPTIGGGIENSSNYQADQEVLLVGFDVDNTLRNQHVELNFSHDTFSFGLSVANTERNDYTRRIAVDNLVIYQPVPDTRERTYGINWSWYPVNRLMISPQWQHSRTRNAGTASVSSNDLWSLQLYAEVIPETLTVQAAWSNVRDEQAVFELPIDKQRLTNDGGSLDIAYRMLRPKGGRPALDWHLRGAYGQSRTSFGTLSQTDKQWQLLLSIELSWMKEP